VRVGFQRRERIPPNEALGLRRCNFSGGQRHEDVWEAWEVWEVFSLIEAYARA
jgi:hypothetical protein